MEVTMTQTKRRNLKHKLKELIQMTNENHFVTVRSLASLIGKINYLRFQFPQISLWMNAISKHKTRTIAKRGWDASVRLQKQILGILQTIMILIKLNKPRQMKDRIPDLTLSTDATEDGWAELMAPPFKQLEGVSRGINIFQIVEGNNIEVEDQMCTTEERLHNNKILNPKMESSISDPTSYQKNISPHRQSQPNDIHRTPAWPLEHDSGCTQPTLLDRGLHDQPIPSDGSTTSNRLSPNSGRLRQQKEQVIRSVLLSIQRQVGFHNKCHEYPLESGRTSITSPIGLIPKVILKLIRDKAAAVLILPIWCLFKHRSMLPQILSQVTLGQSEQVLIRGKFMKEEQKLLQGTIELIKISTGIENNYTDNQLNQQI
ncbi:MAG: hypothetical protein EZS28_026973 [Streblomastix strix]|uniref:Uncharacterized protein n=1 Tax=Streblomastix strix TaxID=222440 RepID=A0A5J4V410_9EUKA|nr:MAG: hypothetical protein EZS28_026973 [Streblomastix strix]